MDIMATIMDSQVWANRVEPDQTAALGVHRLLFFVYLLDTLLLDKTMLFEF